MAQALRPEQMTPADELRALLARSEQRVANLRGSGRAALDLLLALDRISELWPELEAQGVDLRPELGRWETLQAALERRAALLARELRASGGLPAARARAHPQGEPAWWWFAAEQVRAQRLQRLRRAALTLAGTAAALVLLYFLFTRVLFPVDPALRAALDAQADGERKVAAAGDVRAALDDFRRITELLPGDPGGWLRVGCAQLRLGDAAAAAENFRRAEVLLADEVQLRLARAPICELLGLPDQAEADLRAVLAADPQNAQAYYYLANIYEGRGEFSAALEALERASDLAGASAQDELVALARFRMGMLMQQMAGQGAFGPTPTP